MIPDSDLEIGQTRLLEVDNPIVLPSNTHVRFIVTSTDVIHAFALPSAGIKIDATPGRLNQSSFFSERESELYGQCSELCGTYHGFMPIKVEVVELPDYLTWISNLGLISILSNKNLIFNNIVTKIKKSFLICSVNITMFTSIPIVHSKNLFTNLPIFDMEINSSLSNDIVLVKNYNLYVEYLFYSIVLVGLISIIFVIFKTVNETVLNHINFSGPARKLGEKIVKTLTVGAAAAGSYGGAKDVIKDLKNLGSGNNSNSGSGNNSNSGSKSSS